MKCETCNDTHVVHTEIMKGVVVASPCPNCNTAIHEHYRNELNGGNELVSGGTINRQTAC